MHKKNNSFSSKRQKVENVSMTNKHVYSKPILKNIEKYRKVDKTNNKG